MRIYKYWKSEEAVYDFGGERFPIKCFGGSNVSIEDASAKALERIELVKWRIGKKGPEPKSEYEPEIREEPLHVLDEDNVITRNRYGARVLNSRTTMFLDIDHHRLSFWEIFGFGRRGPRKGRIMDAIRKEASKPCYKGLAFRLYETCKGVRVIVAGRPFDAKDKESKRMMRAFNCDPLYTLLCSKQDCFRARLSPKPYRMKGVHGIKVKFPRGPEEDAALSEWLKAYEAGSAQHAVCRFIEQLGEPFRPDDVVKCHDEACRVDSGLKLA